jgi:hypothetical protein
MKHDAIVESGIRILNRHDLPDDLIPPDSHVEIDAKIAAGAFPLARPSQDAPSKYKHRLLQLQGSDPRGRPEPDRRPCL